MLRSSTYAQRLTARFFQAMLLAPVVGVAGAGCTAEVINGSASSGGGAGGKAVTSVSAAGGDPSTSSMSSGSGWGGGGGPGEACFAWPMVAGTSSSSGQGGMGGAPGAGGADGGPPPCPSVPEATTIFLSMGFGCGVSSVQSGPTYKADEKSCCYQVIYGVCSGRPYLVDDEPRTATLRTGSASGWNGGTAPRIEDLDPAIRAQIADAWARDGLAEHASIPSFGRFAFELLAVGAPADLVAEAHHAALDEVRHARLCFGLASAYAGAAIEPGPFPFDGSVEIDADLARMAARVAREGCIDETTAAMQVAEQLAVAHDPAVRAALAIIAEDEARHAELAWRTVAWALRTGGATVRAAVAEVFATLTEDLPPTRNERENPALAAHGRLSAAHLEAIGVHARANVIGPSARALLDAIPRSERFSQPVAQLPSRGARSSAETSPSRLCPSPG